MSDKKNTLLRRDRTWFLLLLKRQLLRPFLWVIAAFMVLAVVSFYYVTAPDANNKRVVLYNENESSDAEDYSNMLIDNLIAASDIDDTIFEFERVQSYEELIEEVTSGRSECGFVITDDFDEKIVVCDTDDLIVYVRSNYTNKGEVAKETVFAEFFEIYGRILIIDEQEEIFGTDDTKLMEALISDYDRLLVGDEVFNADYQTIEGNVVPSGEKKMQSLRGLVMILITMELLLGGSEKFYGTAGKVSKALPSKERTRFEVLMQITGILIPAVVGFVLIRILDPSIAIAPDIVLYLIFVLIAVIWTYIFGKLMNNGISYMAWILTLLIAQFIICPVWKDLAEYVPSMKLISYLFPAGAYLRILNLFA